VKCPLQFAAPQPRPQASSLKPHFPSRLSLQFAAFAGLIGAVCLLTVVPGQGKAAAARAAQAGGSTRIAVVDMSYLFQHYEKLEDLRQSVKQAADAAQEKAKGYIDQAKTLDEQLKSGEFETGSDEFVERENKVIQLSSRFEMFKATATKELKKKDAQVLLAVYEDVRHALELFAEQNGYSLVLQINREVMDTEDKTKIGQKLGHPVFRNQGAEDISEAVLAYLSQQYAAGADAQKPTKAVAEKAAPAPSSAPRNAAAPGRNKSSRR
jgi:Skp family chaperone for outer membrane proteins